MLSADMSVNRFMMQGKRIVNQSSRASFDHNYGQAFTNDARSSITGRTHSWISLDTLSGQAQRVVHNDKI